MNKYSVSIPWHASVIVEVEAENEEEARETALREAQASLCWYCSKKIEIDSVNDDHEPEVMLRKEPV